MAKTLVIEIDYVDDLEVSTAHALTASLAGGEGVVRVRARVTEPEELPAGVWDSSEVGPCADWRG